MRLVSPDRYWSIFGKRQEARVAAAAMLFRRKSRAPLVAEQCYGRLFGGVALGNPVVGGVIFEPPFTQGAGHHVEVVHLVPVGRSTGVMTLWHEDDVTIGNRHRLVQSTILGIDPLDAKALGRVEAVIIWARSTRLMTATWIQPM